MEKLIMAFSNQIREAITISKKNPLSFANKKIDQVYISGLGGSGIGASIVQDFVKDKINIPFTVNKGYQIATSVNENTLFIACSYSGNTEETLSALKAAIKRKARIVCVTSGGYMQDIAAKNNIPCILIPSGHPPRACLGYSLIQLLHILHQAALLKNSVTALFKDVAELLDREEKNIKKEAKTLSKKLQNTLPVIYVTDGNEGLAVRLRQQLNENAKMLCWHAVLPEMTHNEIVGWRKKIDPLAVLVLKDSTATEKNAKRLDFLLSTIKKYCAKIYTVESKGKSYWQRAFYHIHLGDWLSWELSLLNKIDANEIAVINSLKSNMGERKK